MVDSVNLLSENYLVKPVIAEKYKDILNALSAAVNCQHELEMCRLLLEQNNNDTDDLKRKVGTDHLQDLLLESCDRNEILLKKLRLHELGLAGLTFTEESLESNYFTAHGNLIDELESYRKQVFQLKEELYQYLDISPYPHMI